MPVSGAPSPQSTSRHAEQAARELEVGVAAATFSFGAYSRPATARTARSIRSAQAAGSLAEAPHRGRRRTAPTIAGVGGDLEDAGSSGAPAPGGRRRGSATSLDAGRAEAGQRLDPVVGRRLHDVQARLRGPPRRSRSTARSFGWSTVAPRKSSEAEDSKPQFSGMTTVPPAPTIRRGVGATGSRRASGETGRARRGRAAARRARPSYSRVGALAASVAANQSFDLLDDRARCRRRAGCWPSRSEPGRTPRSRQARGACSRCGSSRSRAPAAAPGRPAGGAGGRSGCGCRSPPTSRRRRRSPRCAAARRSGRCLLAPGWRAFRRSAICCAICPAQRLVGRTSPIWSVAGAALGARSRGTCDRQQARSASSAGRAPGAARRSGSAAFWSRCQARRGRSAASRARSRPGRGRRARRPSARPRRRAASASKVRAPRSSIGMPSR